jgi:hypothetical protein
MAAVDPFGRRPERWLRTGAAADEVSLLVVCDQKVGEANMGWTNLTTTVGISVWSVSSWLVVLGTACSGAPSALTVLAAVTCAGAGACGDSDAAAATLADVGVGSAAGMAGRLQAAASTDVEYAAAHYLLDERLQLL